MKTKGDVRGITQFPVHSEQGISTIHVDDVHDKVICVAESNAEDDTNLPSVGWVLQDVFLALMGVMVIPPVKTYTHLSPSQ